MAHQAWDTLSSPSDQAHDWRWQLRHAITTVEQLGRFISLSREERDAADHAQRQGLPLLLTPYMASLMDPGRADCPIRRQLVPSIFEARVVEGDRKDPLGEDDHLVAPHLIRRYPDRALLLVTKGCAVHCRFCTRTRVVRQGRGAIPLRQLDPALSWLRSHPEVREVILSGGDPLLLSDRRIGRLLEAVRSVPHIEIVRIGTRVPGVLPMRVDEGLVDALRPWQPIWIMVHFNHPRELTSEARSALSKLVDGGFPVMCQTVLLRGINDDPAVLEELFRGLVRERVRPYYLLHADVVEGTGHLRTALSRSVEIHAALQGRLSGIALPKLVVDTPGGRGKVVVGPEVIVSRGAGRTTLRTFRGEEAEVVDPPEGKTGDGLVPGPTRA
jgi:lysine 2,3-aminomutase